VLEKTVSLQKVVAQNNYDERKERYDSDYITEISIVFT
jgi:hypothetical protein